MNLENLFERTGLVSNGKNVKEVLRLNNNETTIKIKDNEVIKYNPNFYDGVREAIFYTSLDHPNIIKCKEAEILDYIHLDFDDPRNIAKCVKITFNRYIPCDSDEFNLIFEKNREYLFIKLFEDITSALFYLACSEILHGDIKLANIFYDSKEDRFILPDFDFAVIGRNNFHLRGYTPDTMPPEIDFMVPGVNDTRGDIYSFAITLIGLYMKWGTDWQLNNDISPLFRGYVRSQKNPGLEILASKLGQGRIKYHDKELEKVKESNIPYGNLLIKMADFDHSKRPDIEDIYGSRCYYKQLKITPLNSLFIMTFPEIWKTKEKVDQVFLFLLGVISLEILKKALLYPISYPIKEITGIKYKSGEGFYIAEPLETEVIKLFGVNPNYILNQDELEQLGEHGGEITHEKLIAIFFNRVGFRIIL